MKYDMDEVYKTAKKYNDLNFKKIDIDIYIMLKSLVYDLLQNHSKMWSFPPAGFIDNIMVQLKSYDSALTVSLNNNYPMNGNFIMGMAELIEKMIEENLEYIRKDSMEKAIEYRDRASAILVMVRLFELENIDTV